MSGNDPNYNTLRQDAGFRWYINVSHTAVLKVANVAIEEFNQSAAAGIQAYRQRGRVAELFGPDVQRPAPATPPISYGHLNGLGIELVFPEGGEVNYVHEHRSLTECRRMCEQEIDFARAGMAPFYIDYKRKLQHAFPGESVGFGYSSEGPLTTAYELRGMEVFTDAYDSPDELRMLLEAATRSIVSFRHFQARLRGAPEINPTGFGLYDDVAAMFPPALWPDLVLPHWEAYYRGTTTGKRMLHSEDMTADHLRFLEPLHIVDYDPSISPKINPALIRSNCRVPFRWRMGGFHFGLLDETGVRDWVFQSVADGASCVFTSVAAELVTDEGVRKVKAFAQAAKHAEAELACGTTREDIGALVSPEGRKRFWDAWPE